MRMIDAIMTTFALLLIGCYQSNDTTTPGCRSENSQDASLSDKINIFFDPNKSFCHSPGGIFVESNGIFQFDGTNVTDNCYSRISLSTSCEIVAKTIIPDYVLQWHEIALTIDHEYTNPNSTNDDNYIFTSSDIVLFGPLNGFHSSLSGTSTRIKTVFFLNPADYGVWLKFNFLTTLECLGIKHRKWDWKIYGVSLENGSR